MIERIGELPDNVDQLKALALEALARVDRSETDAQALRSQTLSLTAKIEDLTQTNAAAKAEIDRLTSIIKTLHRDRSEKLGADDAEQQSFVFEEVETGLAAIDARLVFWYRRRWLIEQMFRTLKGQCLRVEESQIIEMEPLAKLTVAAMIAAARVLQLVQARDGATGQTLADAFEEADAPLIEALTAKLEGKTEKQKNPHARGTLARAAWVIGRLGGWSGYVGGGYKPPGPKTMYDGLVEYDAIRRGWTIARLVCLP